MLEKVTSQVDYLANQLEQALSAEDWEKVQGIDEDLRRHFAAYSRLSDDIDTTKAGPLRDSMQRLIALYQRAIAGCNAHRESIRHELQGVQKGRKGIKAYQAV